MTTPGLSTAARSSVGLRLKGISRSLPLRVLSGASQVIGILTALVIVWGWTTGLVGEVVDAALHSRLSALVTERTRFSDWMEVDSSEVPQQAPTDGFLLVVHSYALTRGQTTYWIDTGQMEENLTVRTPSRQHGMTTVPIRTGEYYRVRAEHRVSGTPFLGEPQVFWVSVGSGPDSNRGASDGLQR